MGSYIMPDKRGVDIKPVGHEDEENYDRNVVEFPYRADLHTSGIFLFPKIDGRCQN